MPDVFAEFAGDFVLPWLESLVTTGAVENHVSRCDLL